MEGLRGAEYNPRKISDEQLAKLWESIRRFGVVKPIICKSDGLIVAGHQRTKALRANGVNRAPVYVLPADTTQSDEIKFNQLHNGTDVDHPDANAWIREPLKEGWQQVTHLDANWTCGMQVIRANIASLILKFGPWGACVASLDGEVIHCTQYAMACIQANQPLLVYGVPTERKEEYREFLGDVYGRFNYESLERKTYIQTLAQLNRIRDVPGSTPRESGLYRDLVVPWMKQNPKARGFDFASGKGDYASKLRTEGYDVMDLELFRRVVGKNSIDVVWVNRAISQMIKSIERLGRFDFVVCDSVFNSVDCREAEFAVATMLGALCRVGGTLFFSGRTLKSVKAALNSGTYKVKNGSPQQLYFLDDDGYSGFFRNGEWFYQKFHTQEQAEALCEQMGIPNPKVKMGSGVWQIQGVKESDVTWESIEKAIRYEFELDWPNDVKIGRSEDVLKAFRPHWESVKPQ